MVSTDSMELRMTDALSLASELVREALLSYIYARLSVLKRFTAMSRYENIDADNRMPTMIKNLNRKDNELKFISNLLIH